MSPGKKRLAACMLKLITRFQNCSSSSARLRAPASRANTRRDSALLVPHFSKLKVVLSRLTRYGDVCRRCPRAPVLSGSCASGVSALWLRAPSRSPRAACPRNSQVKTRTFQVHCSHSSEHLFVGFDRSYSVDQTYQI